jgi:uncharacterized protein YecE (DUF72 family)
MASRSLLAFAVFTLVQTPALATTYCCKDQDGRLICGDILPPQCLSRGHQEYNASGAMSKQVDPPLTPEQRARKEAEAARRKEEARKAAEQARQDRALLASYTTVGDIEAKRDRTLADLNANLHRAQERYADSQAQLEKLQQRVQALGNKPVPDGLKLNLSKTDTEASINRAAVEANKQEIAAAQERFEQQRQRFLELTRKPPGAASAATAPASSATDR